MSDIEMFVSELRDLFEYGSSNSDVIQYLENWQAARECELERDRDQWRAQVGRICATLPVSKIADSTMTIGNLVDYFKDLHRENERLRAEAAEKGGDDD